MVTWEPVSSKQLTGFPSTNSWAVHFIPTNPLGKFFCNAASQYLLNALSGLLGHVSLASVSVRPATETVCSLTVGMQLRFSGPTVPVSPSADVVCFPLWKDLVHFHNSQQYDHPLRNGSSSLDEVEPKSIHHC